MKELIHEFIKQQPRSRKEISMEYYIPMEKVDLILVNLFEDGKVILLNGKWKSIKP
jgi:hypothetical protein